MLFVKLSKVSNRGGSNVNNISRNAISVLKRFELILIKNDRVVLNKTSIEKYGGAVEAVWSLAKNDSSLVKCVEILDMAPNIASKDLAEKISNEYSLNWSEGSIKINGGILKQWSGWVKEGIATSSIPMPPGRPNKHYRGEVADGAILTTGD